MQNRREVQIRRDHQIERGSSIVHIVGINCGQLTLQKVAQSGIPQSSSESHRLDATKKCSRGVADYNSMSRDRWNEPQGLSDRLVGCHLNGCVKGNRLLFYPADSGIQVLQVKVLRQNRETTAAGESGSESRTGHRVRVGRDNWNSRAGAIRRGQRHLKSRPDRRVARHQEHIGVGQIMLRRCLVKLHVFKANASRPGADGSAQKD